MMRCILAATLLLQVYMACPGHAAPVDFERGVAIFDPGHLNTVKDIIDATTPPADEIE